MPESSEILAHRLRLLEFFDEAPESSHYHATAIVAVAGEELGLGLLVHYFTGVGQAATVISRRCTPGTKKGARLDAWVEVGETLYQVEIKNWSAHAFNGRPLPINAPVATIEARRQQRWRQLWDGHRFTDKSIAKVLGRMKPPRPHPRIEPLVCFWDAVHPEGSADPLFSVLVERAAFSRVWVFSMSNYLRVCTSQVLLLQMPRTRQRMRWLAELFGTVAALATAPHN